MIRNPILPGFHPDPCICRKGKDFYLAVSSFEWMPALPIYHSTDLEHWSLISHAICDASMLSLENVLSAKGVWAPCLTYVEAEDMFYITYNVVYANNAGCFSVDNYVITSRDPRGPWSAPVYLHSAGFDGSMFHDEDGRKYILSLEWETRDDHFKPGEICIAEYSPKEGTILGYPKRIWRGATRRGCVEGPHMFKRNGWYYLMCAEGGTGYGHCVTLARSRSVFGPYESDPNGVVLTSAEDFDEMDNSAYLKPERYNPQVVLQKAGHGSLTDTPAGEWYMVHHCGRPITPELRCTMGREACIQKMHWTDDGWLRLWDGSHFAREFTEKPLGLECCEVQMNAGKNGIPLVWSAPRIEPSSFASHDMGTFVLRGQEHLSSMHRVSLLARPLSSMHASFEADIAFEPEVYQHYAGLCIYYDQADHLMLRKTYDPDQEKAVLQIVMVSGGERREIPGTKTLCPAGVIRMRICIDDRSVSFAWRTVDGNWNAIGGEYDVSVFSDEYCKAGEFTGTSIGFFCVDGMLHCRKACFANVEYKEWIP